MKKGFPIISTLVLMINLSPATMDGSWAAQTAGPVLVSSSPLTQNGSIQLSREGSRAQDKSERPNSSIKLQLVADSRSPRENDRISPDIEITNNNAADRKADDTPTQSTKKFVKGSDILGRNVIDINKKKIGTIRDMAVDLANGRVLYVVVAEGSALERAKLIAMPPQAFGPLQEKKPWILKVPQKKIDQATALPEDKWISELDKKGLDALYQSMEITPPSDWKLNPSLSKASDVIGGKVTLETIKGKDEGSAKVEDLAVNLHDGSMPYVILSLGGFGFMGLKDELIAFPSAQLTPEMSEEGRFKIEATEEQLKKMPSLDKDNWENTL